MFAPPEFTEGEPAGVNSPSGLRMGAKLANALAASAREIIRLGRLRVAPPLSLDDGTEGRRLGVKLTPQFWAKLSGSGNPYSFVQQQFTPGSGFTDMPGGRTVTSNAYDSNNQSGLSGSVVRVNYESTSNDWRFQFVRVDTRCAGTVIVRGCLLQGVDGASVTVTQGGSTVASGTTSGGGLFAFKIPKGTTTVAVTPPAGSGFAAYSSTFTYDCGTVTVDLLLDSDHVCTPRCNNGIPKTLFTSDGYGTHALLYLGVTSGTHQWQATYNSGVTAWNFALPPNSNDCTTDGTVIVKYTLNCSAASWLLDVGYGVICCSLGAGGTGPFVNKYANGVNGGTSANHSSETCSPLSIVFNLATSVTFTTCTVPPTTLPVLGGGGTMTVTP